MPPINCVAPFFSVPEIAVPQNTALAVRKAESLGVVGSRTNGFDLMGGFFWEPHHANHDPPSRMGSDVSRFVGRAACMDADGCLHKSVNIPTVLFSPQWVFAQNPVEQQTTELPYKFRGNKIGSWGRNNPVGALKEKPPCDQSTPKNQVASENFRVFGKRTVCIRAGVRAEITGLCGIWLPYSPAIQQHVGLLLFWNFFLSDKEKSGTFSFYKRKELCPVGRQSKS